MSRIHFNQVKRGVGIVSAACAVGCSVIGLSCYAKNTILLSKYSDYMELQGMYGPMEPSDGLRDLVNETKDEIINHISPHTKIEPILVPGMKPRHAGTIGTHYGGVIGLPAFFEYKRIEDIQDEIKTNDDYISDEVEEVYQSYLLTESAKKYAIAREILLVNKFQVYIDMVLPYSIFYMTYHVTNFAKHNLPPLPITHMMSRFGVYSVCTFLGLFTWSFIHSNVRFYNESEAEETITKLGLNFINGGIEYCTKELERNSSSELKNQNSNIAITLEDYIYNKFLLKHISPQLRLAYLKGHKRKIESEGSIQPI